MNTGADALTPTRVKVDELISVQVKRSAQQSGYEANVAVQFTNMTGNNEGDRAHVCLCVRQREKALLGQIKSK